MEYGLTPDELKRSILMGMQAVHEENACLYYSAIRHCVVPIALTLFR